MSYKSLPPMPGAWPSDDTNPTSPLTFTLTDFISAASTAQIYLETTLQQSKPQVWLSETMTNMTLFTYAEELVEKSVAYVTYIAPYIGFFLEDQFPLPLADGVILSYTLVEVGLLRAILRYSRETGMHDDAVMTLQAFKEGMETYRLIKSIQGLVASYIEVGNTNTDEPPQISETTEVYALAYVDSLATVDVKTAMRDDVRCPFCWGAFGAGEDGCCGKRFGRDCLVEAMLGSLLCPNCRREFAVRCVEDGEDV